MILFYYLISRGSHVIRNRSNTPANDLQALINVKYVYIHIHTHTYTYIHILTYSTYTYFPMLTYSKQGKKHRNYPQTT